MPELPEVETIRRGLKKLIISKKFINIDIRDTKAVKYPVPEQFKEKILYKGICSIGRKGKYLIISLSNFFNLLIHLRMTGQLVYYQNYKDGYEEKCTRVIFYFSDRSVIFYYDQRRLGEMWLLSGEQITSFPGLTSLGPDILEEVDFELFNSLLLRRNNSRIKPLLLDQKFVAGLGNIYTDEALFCACIHPKKIVKFLTKGEIKNLFDCIQRILHKSLAKSGTSTRNYVNIRGQAGEFQKHLQVYRRDGQPCPRCGHPIERIKVGGRGTYYCSCCQPY